MIFPSRFSTERESQPPDIAQPLFNRALRLRFRRVLDTDEALHHPKQYVFAIENFAQFIKENTHADFFCPKEVKYLII